MKNAPVAILLAVFSIACGIYCTSRTSADGELAFNSKLANCTLHLNKSIISCQHSTGIPIDCDVVADLSALNTASYFIMALSKHPMRRGPSTNHTHYHIYSRPDIKNTTLETRLWQDYTFKRQNKRIYIELSHVQETGHTGLRVRDVKCYKRLMDLFERIKDFQKIQIRGSHRRAKIFAFIKIA